jgi:AcrR family transcriptional regulator
VASDAATAPGATRRYESPLRRDRAARTRERIVDAACALMRHSSVRDWRSVTIRGVAQRAGVNERTVYRYFVNERGLRDAVMHRMEEEAGIELPGMELGDIGTMAARLFGYVATFPFEPKPPLDPTLDEANRRQHEALRGAVAPWTTEWDPADAAGVAALFDVLWSVGAYERLTRDWQLDRPQATRTLIWAIEVVADAIRTGRRPEELGR